MRETILRIEPFSENRWVQILFPWILKSLDFGISTKSSDSPSKMSQESREMTSRDDKIL